MSGTYTGRGVKRVYIEAALKGTDGFNNPTLMQELKPYYDPAHLQETYSKEAFQAATDVVLRQLYLKVPREEGRTEFGRKTFQGYYKGTIVGSVALAAIKIMTSHRLVSVSRRLWEDSGIGETDFEQITERKYLMRHRNFLFYGHCTAGVGLEAFVTSGRKNVRFQLEELPPSGPGLYNFDIVFEWD